MSLIERALGKAKDTPGSVDTGATTSRRMALKLPPQRIVAEPDLRITQDMQQALGLIAPKEQEHQRASEYRHIKRRIVSEIRENQSRRVVLVASAVAGEGKSFTSANLSRSLALEPDFSVLLIDADVVKPRLSESLQVADRAGLMEALVDPACDVERLVLTTDVEGLSFLPSGSSAEHATELFASERMRELLDRLLMVPNRIIVIDSLPLLQTTEARVLAPLAGQVLLVVRAESTPQSSVDSALQVIGPGANVKLILNATVRTRVTRYLGYGHGHGYGYNYNYGTTPDREATRK